MEWEQARRRERERCSFQLSFDVFRHNFFLRSTISNCMHRHMKHRANGKRRRMSNVELHVEQYTRSARAGKCATVTVLTATIMSRSRIKMAKTLFIFKKHYTSMHKHWTWKWSHFRSLLVCIFAINVKHVDGIIESNSVNASPPSNWAGIVCSIFDLCAYVSWPEKAVNDFERSERQLGSRGGLQR